MHLPPALGHIPPRRSLVALGLRFGVLIALLVGGFLAFRFTPLARFAEPTRFLALLETARGHWWTPLVLLGLYVVLCTLGLPATPLIFVGGAIFGVAAGSLWNALGTYLSTAATFWLAHLLGREFLERVGGEKMRRAERILHRHGFWAMVGVRFLPVPFPLVNAAAGVSGVRFTTFFLASALGLAPAVFVLTWVSAALVRAAGAERGQILGTSVAAFALFLTLAALPPTVRRLRRRARLRHLRAARRDRR